MRVKYRTLLSIPRLPRFCVCEYLKPISTVAVFSAAQTVKIDSAIAMSQRRVLPQGECLWFCITAFWPLAPARTVLPLQWLGFATCFGDSLGGEVTNV